VKIAIACSGLGHITRGIEAWAGDMAAALAGRSQSVTLYKGSGRPGADYEKVLSCWPRTGRGAQRAIRWLPKSSWHIGLGTEYQVEQATFTLGLLRTLRRSRADILHVQDPLVALIAQRASRLKLIRAKVILGHGTNEPASYLKKITYLQHLSPWQRDEWRKAGVYRPTWCAIPNFIDTRAFRPGRSPELRAELGIPEDAVVVLSAAAVKKDHKRIDHLVAEMGRLKAGHPDRPVWLVVAGGREPDTDEVVRMGHELLGDRVRFLVQFPRARMAELYRAADLFALCSLREMMPIALIEAAASGLPCLVHRHPVLEWMTGAGGRVVDMAAPGALAEAVLELAADPDRRADLGRASRDQAVRQFDRDPVVSRVLDYYASCRAWGRRAERPAPRPAHA
jgi:1,2-diacylglycerol 3-alpha-glucosyltransferase